MTAQVRLGVFGPSVLVGVAAATGALDRAGLTVAEVPAASSAQQCAALLAGDLDAALTSPDNVLGWRDSPGRPDVRIVAAIDRGLGLSLFSRPGVDSAGLRGGVLGVDVPKSGFAFAAYALLARLGLHAGLDYEVRPLGTTPRRTAALAAGECTMTVLNAGNDLRAEAAGCTRISRASTLGPYLGSALAAPLDARCGSAALRTLTFVLVSTARALLRGQFRAEAATVAAARLGLDDDGVGRNVRTITDPREGLVADGRIDPRALQTLCWLRSSHGAGGPALEALVAPGSGLVDDRFLTDGGTR